MPPGVSALRQGHSKGRPSRTTGTLASRSISTDLSAHPRTKPIAALNTLVKLLSSLSTRIGRCQYKLTPAEHALSLHLVSILDPYVYQGAKTLTNASSAQVKPTFVGFVFQPTEILDKIMSYLDSRRDLLNVALCCKQLHDVVFPRHFDYRVIRCKVSSISVWNHLITNHGLARNVRRLEIIDERSSPTMVSKAGSSSLAVPRGIAKRDTDLESTDDELVMHKKQERYLCRALHAMTGLREIKWSCNHSPISIDHVWPALVERSRTLEVLDFSDNLLFTPRNVDSDSSEVASDSEGESDGQPSPLPATSVITAIFRSTRHNYGGSRQPDMARINEVLSRSPELQTLSISFARLRSQSGALPSLEGLIDSRWARLRSLTLVGLRTTSSALTQLLMDHPQLTNLHLEVFGASSLDLRPGSLPNLRELHANKDVISSILDTSFDESQHLEVVKGFKLSGVHATVDGKHADAALFHSLKRHSNTVKHVELAGWNDMDDIRKLSSALRNIAHLDVGKRFGANPGRAAAQAGPVTNVEEWLEVLETLPELRALHGVKFFYEISSINLLHPTSANSNLSPPSSFSPGTGTTSHSSGVTVDSATAAKIHSQMSLMDRSRIKKNDWTASMLVWRCPKLRRVDHWDEGTSRIIALTRGSGSPSAADPGMDSAEVAVKENHKVRWEVRRVKAV